MRVTADWCCIGLLIGAVSILLGLEGYDLEGLKLNNLILVQSC